MKIIICGAGQVGRGIAERLAGEGNDVTVIDVSPNLVQSLSDSLDVQGIIGHGAHPDVLERAGAREADMIIAVTFTDEVNMMACEVAHAIFSIPTRIARVRDQSYLQPEYRDLFSSDHTAIDVVISPELAVGDMVLRRLELPGAFDTDIAKAWTPEMKARAGEINPMKRIGRPEDLVGVCVFLASDAASYVNGAQVLVDGGLFRTL